jgi:hypothetical protein
VSARCLVCLGLWRRACLDQADLILRLTHLSCPALSCNCAQCTCTIKCTRTLHTRPSVSMIAFLLGATTSILCGYLGMKIAT